MLTISEKRERGQQLKSTRKLASATLRQVAEVSHLPIATISRIENNKFKGEDSAYLKIEDALLAIISARNVQYSSLSDFADFLENAGKRFGLAQREEAHV